ncbi:acetyltransferase [Pyrus ussuriensis x Pyrus communis]|uniref:Acetyltransferase n=1 Tax=Pyrus ussuriensis x Pyrus communis TaxID=2448454 RepID=A0A5N5I8G7_9ROSA|nr:acetyltransferase [Pyrus ussuriensis x Pyrus communis]
MCETQGNPQATLLETTYTKENVVVLETPEPVKVPELYTRIRQRTLPKIRARKSQEEEYPRGLRNWTCQIEKLGEPAIDARRKKEKREMRTQQHIKADAKLAKQVTS